MPPPAIHHWRRYKIFTMSQITFRPHRHDVISHPTEGSTTAISPRRWQPRHLIPDCPHQLTQTRTFQIKVPLSNSKSKLFHFFTYFKWDFQLPYSICRYMITLNPQNEMELWPKEDSCHKPIITSFQIKLLWLAN